MRNTSSYIWNFNSKNNIALERYPVACCGEYSLSYLYETDKTTKYKDDWSIIYNLDRTFELLKDYKPYLETFTGINDLKFSSNNMNDSILVYRKH